MKKAPKNCKHCNELFQPRRKNHVYCCTSCKTMASYKRNQYKYVSGHYKKDIDLQNPADQLNVPDVQPDDLMPFEENQDKPANNKDKVNLTSIANAGLGALGADATVYGLKKLFMPDSLPLTVADGKILLNKIAELKKLLNSNKY